MTVATYGKMISRQIIELYQSGKALGSPNFDALYPVKHYVRAAEKIKVAFPQITPSTVAMSDIFYGDIFFSCSALSTASSIMALKSSRKTYLYLFNHTASDPGMSIWGPNHVFEMAFTFGNFEEFSVYLGSTPWKPTAFEQKLSRDMMDYWLNFARNGSPNTESSAAKWPVAGCGEENNFMVFSDTLTKV